MTGPSPLLKLTLGRPPRFNRRRYEADHRYMADFLEELCRYLERAFSQIEFTDESRQVANTDRNWTITNDQDDRTFDADTVAVAELADVVATVIHDLEDKGALP